ncbi:hypothetical protein [Amphritea balenae]|uniref:Uncharacterized protein n=1 Tax=Amphritea balenae TaxID=452629 RepID=A0A3P1SWX0_9GAMM|nr:hypothetical protein [Amphritea balenae]RRD01737.1 hypothetical protein EHS89_04090 [Amphritea balenae]GGK54515.1 hypothetical protein GCM10007941_00690 [Amphritea balenae]
MVLFFPINQELDCISSSGRILGKIKFDVFKEEYLFYPDDDSVVLSDIEVACVAERIAGLYAGKYSFPMQDDD